MSRQGEKLARWVLLCALVWAVLAMHHVGSPSAAPASSGHAMAPAATHTMHAPAPEPSGEAPLPTGLHDLLHLCMAVICAFGLALGLRLFRRLGVRASSARPRAGQHSVPMPARPPPRWGRDLLHSACVLRV